MKASRGLMLGVVAGTLLLTGASPAAAERGCDGVQLFERARFGPAEECFRAALEDPEGGSVDPSVAHAYIAALRLIEDDDAGARAHVALALALADAVSSPPGSPPELEELLVQGRVSRRGERLSLAIDSPECPAAGSTPRVRAEVNHLPAGVPYVLHLQCDSPTGEPAQAQRSAFPSVEVEPSTVGAAAGDAIACTARLLGEGGDVYLTESTEVTLCEPEAAPIEGGRGGAPEDFWLWFGIGTASVVVAVVAITVGVIFGTAPTEANIGSAVLEP